MTNQPATQPHAREDSIIPARRDSVTVLCAHAFLAIIWRPWACACCSFSGFQARPTTAKCIFNWPATGPTIMSTDCAEWPTGSDGPPNAGLPGLPGRSGSTTWTLDTGHFVVSGRARRLYLFFDGCPGCGVSTRRLRAGALWIIALWLAATCPFLANYSAVVLTEVLVTFLATAALCLFRSGTQAGARAVVVSRDRRSMEPAHRLCLLLGAFFSPGWRPWCAPKCRCFWPSRFSCTDFAHGGLRALEKQSCWLRPWLARFCCLSCPGPRGMPFPCTSCNSSRRAMPRFPANTPPVGYYAWTGTWLERYRDVYFTVWKIGEDRIGRK